MLRKISSLAIFSVALGSYVEAQDSTEKKFVEYYRFC
jgi:hypothetical protein